MTSLIDVIFLLLLFFMLTSTFSKFAEVDLSVASSGSSVPSDRPPLFLQLRSDEIRLNGDIVTLETVSASSLAEAEEGTVLLVSLGAQVDAQRLTDLLVTLRSFPKLQVNVLGS
ncbi:Outer membrane transport energization protein ExbD [Sulfitobacter donghicola DSW-25 = KCTC 12864 = JCM 14565]|uniref:Biopolymer transporter ExbD n=2 Tax=Sulfitobacter TaxID=60136 RepID=A0A073IG83_9RHOB|nr:biopolymer transporter ExbD [Sulfitobacter donghicola DSW-25 = KCTC 12864 = JCM 14565]KIN69633.1 Outer membrane transport energization protein ExbD [Sulfitobacter donghicola DSW-25 = KCTC 12864 = JCM 14565]